MSVFITKLKSLFSLIYRGVKGENQDYTSGSINHAIILLSVPMIIEMGMESIFAIVDVFFVSQLNDNDALGAVGLTESVLSLVYSLAFGLSMGATALVARRVGEKDAKGAEESAVQALYLGLFITLVLTVAGLLYADHILRFMGGSEELIRNNGGYTRIMFGGNITIIMLFMINGIFRGAGDAALAMRALLIANGLNIILDPVFIFGFGPIPAMGVNGAAIATNIGRGIGVLYQVYHLIKGSSVVRLHWDNFILRGAIISNMIKVSLGGIVQMLIGSASWIFLMRLMSDFGSAPLAGYFIAIRIIVFAILPAWGMANASATLVGQNLGAGLPDRAEKSVWRAGLWNMVFLAGITVLFYTMADFILSLFSQDQVVLFHGRQCLRIISLGYVFYAYGMVINQSFNGAGDTLTPTVIAVFGFWVLQIPLAYALSQPLGFGPLGVYSAIVFAESTMAVVGILLFRRGKWKLVKV
jgi:putative MATE family efflux protein